MTEKATERGPDRSLTAPARIPINVLFGVPDDNRASARVTPDGKRVDFTLPGTANMVAYLSKRFALNPLHLQQGGPLPRAIAPGAFLNHIADADICSRALELAKQVAQDVARPCFNHPIEVAGTTRDGVAQALAGIPGLTVPKTIRIKTTTPSAFRQIVDQEGLAYPILVRVPGFHGGLKIIRIDKKEAIEDIAKLRSGGESLYATEFRDFVSPDGRYRKFRVVVVGDEIHLRTCIIGDNWLLGRGYRAPDSEKEERDQLETFDRNLAPHLKPVFEEIARRLGVDYFGVDCNIDKNGQVLLFEANACMNILRNNFPPPNIWDAPIKRISAAVEQLLASPEKWRQYWRSANASATLQ